MFFSNIIIKSAKKLTHFRMVSILFCVRKLADFRMREKHNDFGGLNTWQINR